MVTAGLCWLLCSLLGSANSQYVNYYEDYDLYTAGASSAHCPLALSGSGSAYAARLEPYSAGSGHLSPPATCGGAVSLGRPAMRVGLWSFLGSTTGTPSSLLMLPHGCRP